jgi:lactoylglutathione lyase
MRDYLASRGVAVPAAVPKGRTGNKNFNIKDPDGHTVEVVEYQSDSWSAREAGKFMPSTRVSDHMTHVGVLVGNLDAATRFYGGILGFRGFWRGSAANSKTLSWVNMRVPDGDDYIEFMLYDTLPAPDRRGTANHVCLVVPDVAKAVAKLEAQPARKDYSRQIAPQTGINRRRQANLYDPDGTRVELMEADTIDGQPAPPSTQPPPR